MDQETPKGPDKRNWRERLGIGTVLPAGTPGKDLPRIGEDYRKVTPAPIAPRSPAPIAPRSPAPIAPRAPAPIAPRAPAPRALPPKVEVKVTPTVKPAPMAPRPAAAAKPPLVRSNTPAVSPEKLAERLRAQRDASEKFAEQRIQVAKQRAEQAQQPVVPVAPQKPVSPPKQAAAKPKFSFAEEDAAPKVAPVVQQRAIVPPPAPPPVQIQPVQVNVQPPVITPQLAPARPPLGTAPGGYQQPRPQQQYQQPNFQQPNVQQPYFPQQQPYGSNGNGGFAPTNYRPIDPATGYPVQPQQYGQQPYGAPPMQRPYGAPAGNYQPPPTPRLGMPPALQGGMQQRPGINPNYAPQGELGAMPPQQGMNPGFGLETRGNGQLNAPTGGPGLSPMRTNRPPLRTPSNPGPLLSDDDPNDELFEEAPSRTPRRAATDYQQAYREVEAGYEDEAPRNKGPWILLGLLLLTLLLAVGGGWYLTKILNPLPTQTSTEEQQLPVVDPPESAAKVAPDRSLTATETPGAPTKKQIYDRIVGDREVLKGDVVPTEEVPLAPDAAVPLPVPDPVQPSGDAGQTVTPPAPVGDSSDPLPIPAPPGDASPQGSLEDDPNKQSAEVITPAAGESQAAVAAPTPLGDPVDAPLDSRVDALKPPTPVATETPAVPEDVASTDATTPDAIETPKPAVETEAIADTADTAGLPSPKLRKIEAAPKPKKIVAKKEVEKDLGSKPVVLVPANKQAKLTPKKVVKTDEPDVATGTTGDSLFEVGENANQQAATPPAVQQPTQQTPVKKKKTLLDFLSGSEAADTQTPAAAETIAPKPATPAAKVIAPKVAPKPAEEIQVASNSGFVAQLASFRSKAEATAEFSRLRSKHGGVFQGVSPIISEAEVGGSTRFRLNVGGMDSKAAADAFCSKLFATGERDCLVRKR